MKSRPQQTLRNSALCAGMSADQVQRLAEISAEQTFGSGRAILTLGDEATQILIVEVGSVALAFPLLANGNARELTLEQIEPPAVLGWSALVPPHRLTLAARAVVDSRLLTLARADLESVFAEEPDIERLMMRNLTRIIGGRLALFEGLLLRELQRHLTLAADGPGPELARASRS